MKNLFCVLFVAILLVSCGKEEVTTFENIELEGSWSVAKLGWNFQNTRDPASRSFKTNYVRGAATEDLRIDASINFENDSGTISGNKTQGLISDFKWVKVADQLEFTYADTFVLDQENSEKVSALIDVKIIDENTIELDWQANYLDKYELTLERQ